MQKSFSRNNKTDPSEVNYDEVIASVNLFKPTPFSNTSIREHTNKFEEFSSANQILLNNKQLSYNVVSKFSYQDLVNYMNTANANKWKQYNNILPKTP